MATDMAKPPPQPVTQTPTQAQAQAQAHPPSSNPSSARTRPEGVRYRASKACRRCNEKRVKCDASERGTPCTRCIQRQEPDCRLIQSRRGIYVRKPRPRPAAAASDPAQPDSGVGDKNDEAARQTSNAPNHGVPCSPGVSSAAAPDPRIPQGTNDLPSGNPEGGNASLYDRTSWATMFNQLLDGHRDGEDVLDKCSITYLGESFPLSIVLKDLKGENAGRPLLHHMGPPCSSSGLLSESRRNHHPTSIRPEELAFVEAMGAFRPPTTDVLEALVAVFLDTVFPIYPIVNRQEFLEQHKLRKTPWILLHALCSVSATFCPPQILYRAGFETRQQARWLFYSRAKALFDVGYETNKIVLLQVAILMSFWGGGPDDNWNFYSWIGMGVTIAETIGCHRSMAGTNIRPQDRSLLKRLWWVLVVRDASSAALIGRPFKVNLDHCDVDALSVGDFQHDMAPEHSASQNAPCSVLYQIHATKLAVILRRIILARFQPRPNPSMTSASLREMLVDWRSHLPPELNWSGNVGECLNMFGSTLSTMYNHNLILTYLASGAAEPRPDDASEAPSSQDMIDEAMNQAAQQIALVACSVVTRCDIFSAPHELFHGVFVAAVVFYMQTKNANQMVAQLGMSGLTNCKMVFQASRETWDPSPWFTQLFDKGLFALSPHIFNQSPLLNSTTAPLHSTNSTGCPDASMGNLFPVGCDMYQYHPVLGNLLDMALSASPLMATGLEFDNRSGTPWFSQ
ncbi:fungal-specific transcription factor domain-containing protein [Thelonectria olida]|uniref:Fungal-specific transcription factor domain-containing protein n=1 Tax=Thelonectria olida TaxID=1576542 RepID=A0A9P9AHR2_9HYPO|nr:fungal-specific transcription factor domain-containing protein [Thelonectria olida]